jgi:hypothetical protein
VSHSAEEVLNHVRAKVVNSGMRPVRNCQPDRGGVWVPKLGYVVLDGVVVVDVVYVCEKDRVVGCR